MNNPVLFAAAALLVTSIPADAITRYTSTVMTCDRVQATIAQDGAAIMRYRSRRNPSLPLYNRFVNDERFCKQDEYTRTVFIPRPRIPHNVQSPSAGPSTSTAATESSADRSPHAVRAEI